MENQLTYDDYKRRISIRDILQDAGYRQNRKDGMRYPTFSTIDQDGKRVKGDKFILTANGLCCFRPPEIRNYNIISFIKQFPEKFQDYTAGMNLDLLVNKVCHRLLGEPYIQNRKTDLMLAATQPERRAFSLKNYTINKWKEGDWDSQKLFYPPFKSRGLSKETQKAFSEHFFMVTNQAGNRSYRNLAFPLRIPGNSRVAGLELRGYPNKDGSSFKGMAQNSDATHGVWLAIPGQDAQSLTQLRNVKEVYWFESAYDAMSYYQLSDDKRKFQNALFVSTGGNPSVSQLRGVLQETERASQHLCFDRDKAGQLFAINFAIAKAGKDYATHLAQRADVAKCIAKEGQLIVEDKAKGDRYVLNMTPFDFGRITSTLGVGSPDMGSYIRSMKDRSNVMSGDLEELPYDSNSYNLYGKLFDKEEGYHTGEPFWGIPPEELEEAKRQYGKEAAELRKMLRENLQKDMEAYRTSKGTLVYEPCHPKYKDYNDQLLDRPMTKEESQDLSQDKKQMTSENIIESGLDGTDGIYQETSESHEEEDEQEKEERKNHYRR